MQSSHPCDDIALLPLTIDTEIAIGEFSHHLFAIDFDTIAAQDIIGETIEWIWKRWQS